MSIVQWELFRMCKALNSDFDNRHELPYQAELGTARANIENLQGIVSIGQCAFIYNLRFSSLNIYILQSRYAAENPTVVQRFCPRCNHL